MLDQILAILAPVIGGLAGQYGWIASALMWVATFRLIFKPLVTFLQAFTEATPTKTDNELLAKVMNSSGYKGFAWALDLLTSIKLPKPVAVIEKK